MTQDTGHRAPRRWALAAGCFVLAAMPVQAMLKHFRDEFEYFIVHKRSKNDGRLECLPEVVNA